MTGGSAAGRAAPVDKAGAAGGFLLFTAIGALYALYGPIIPTLRESFDISATAAALALSAHFGGAMVGILAWALGESRLGSRPLLGMATLLVAVGALGFAAAPTWPVALAAAAIIGVGFGALVVGLNRIFATGFGVRSAALLNILGACFGFGAIVGPLALPISDDRFALPFMGCASMAAVGLPLVRRAPEIPPSCNHTAAIHRNVPGRLWGFAAFYILYVGVESGIGAWEATHLLHQDASEASAANWTAAYWGAITLGRVLAAPVALRVAPSRLVVSALVLTTAALALAHVAVFTPFAYVAAGFVLAPVFPTGLAWLTSSLPSVRGATATVIAGAQLGGVIIPPVIGRLVAVGSPAIIPTSVLAVAATCLTTARLLDHRHPVPRTDV